MIDFQTGVDQRKELEAAAFLILACFLGFLAGFAFIVVKVTRWWLGA